MSPLQARKRLLVLESDLNRALLTAEVQSLRSGALWLTEVRGWAPWFRQGLMLAGPLAGLLRRKPKAGAGNERRSWWARLTNGVKRLGLAMLFVGRLASRWRKSRPPQ